MQVRGFAIEFIEVLSKIKEMYKLYYNNGFSYATHNRHCGKAQAKLAWITLVCESLKWVLHRKSTMRISMEKYFSERVALCRRFGLKLYQFIIMDELKEEHEKGDNFELQLRERNIRLKE